MKIVDIKLYDIAVNRTYETVISSNIPVTKSRFYVLRVQTDAEIVGWGEVSDLPDGFRFSRDCLERELRAILIGLAPYDLGEALDRWDTRMEHYELDRIVYNIVPCAIDGALYDIMGKAAHAPASSLLGGKFREAIPVSWVAYIRSPEELSREVEQKVRQGFSAFKLKVGINIEQDEARLRVLREVAGDNAHIKLDANGAWSATEAVANLRRLEKYHPDGIETPVPYADIDGKVYVKRRTGIPLIEHVRHLDYGLELIRAKAVDVFNVSTVGCGGIYRARKVLALAEAAELDCLLGSTVELGIGTAAQLQLGASSSLINWPSDLVGPLLYTEDIIHEQWKWVDGSLCVPEGPGLGINPDSEKLSQ